MSDINFIIIFILNVIFWMYIERLLVSSDEEDESLDPETKAVREKERRHANNARER